MRIAWVEPTSGPSEMAPLWNALRRHFARLARAGTEIEMRHLRVSGNYVRSLYAELLNNQAMVEAAVAAAHDGFDAAVLGCWADPLWEARQAVDIPVVGIGEASMLLATTLGARFAVITVAPGVVPTIEIDLRLYGLEDRAICRPVRALDPPSDTTMLLRSVDDPHGAVIPNFERVARECIEDGAEVIVVGCGYYGPILSMHGYTEVPGTGVPVVDCSAVGLKLAETMVDLKEGIGLRKSRRGYFMGDPAELLDTVRRVHGLA